jgi:hypothetical protein
LSHTLPRCGTDIAADGGTDIAAHGGTDIAATVEHLARCQNSHPQLVAAFVKKEIK